MEVPFTFTARPPLSPIDDGLAQAASPGIIGDVLGWWPLLWTIRVALLIVVVTGTGVFLLLVARFFRWKHMKEMFTADLPVVRTVGGKFAGVEATAQLAAADEAAGKQLELVSRRLDELHDFVQTLARVVADVPSEGTEDDDEPAP
jgi:hypothetical protein